MKVGIDFLQFGLITHHGEQVLADLDQAPRAAMGKIDAPE